MEVAGEAAWVPVRHISGRRPTSLLATSRIFSLGNHFLRVLIYLLLYVPFGALTFNSSMFSPSDNSARTGGHGDN